jgi:hypothetical protein
MDRDPPMRLMFFGSLLVVLGIVALAAMERVIDGLRAAAYRTQPLPPVIRFVRADGPTAVVWQTSTAANDCAVLLARRKRREKELIAELMRAADSTPSGGADDPCVPFQLGEVERGTKVEVLDEYGRMARIRLLSGSLRDRRGFIERERLAERPAG